MVKNVKLGLLTSLILVLTLAFYIIITFLNISLLPTVGKYTFLSLVAILFVMLLRKKPITKGDIRLFFPFILFNLVYVFNINGLSQTDAIMIVVNQTSFGIIMILIYKLTWTKFQIKNLSFLYLVSLPILLVVLFLFTGMLNKNTIGGYIFFLSFFPLLYIIGYSSNLNKLKAMIILMLTSTVIVASDSRSILLSAGFGLITFVFWKVISSKKLIFNLYFFLIMAISFFVVIIYPNMHKWNNFYKLDELSMQITGKPLLTGRNTIWSQLIDLISLKPWFGYGSSALPENFLSTSLSAHNMYLQIALQVGFVGVTLLMIFFYFIWRSFYKNRKDPRLKVAACFFVSILIYQLLEVTLTQNQFGLGLLQWMIIGFGLNYAFNHEKSSTLTN